MTINRSSVIRLVRMGHPIDFAECFDFDVPDDAHVHYELSVDQGRIWTVYSSEGESLYHVEKPAAESFWMRAVAVYADQTEVSEPLSICFFSAMDTTDADMEQFLDLAESEIDTLSDDEWEIELEDMPDNPQGFWVHRGDGSSPIHINGDPNMSQETVDALLEVFDHVKSQYCFHDGIKDNQDHMLQRTIFDAYTFELWRCPKCKMAFVEVRSRGYDGILATVPTSIDLYNTANPDSGYAYYWRFMDRKHSSRPIRGLQPKQKEQPA